FLGLGELRDVARMQHKRGALWQRVDLVDRLTKRCRDVLVRFLREADVAVADLCEEDALSLGVGEERQAAHREGLWNAARHAPDGCCSRPRHAAQEASAIDAIVAEVRRYIVATGRTRVSVFVESVVV